MDNLCSFPLFTTPPAPQARELDPSAVLPLGALLAFMYFDLNLCGYLHKKDMEKVLLTLGLHLCKEQVSPMPSSVLYGVWDAFGRRTCLRICWQAASLQHRSWRQAVLFGR